MKKSLVIALSLIISASIQAADFETATEAVKNMGLGWNLGNTLEANSQSETDMTKDAYWGQQGLESETCWGQYVTKPELLKMMKDAGFGAIRVPVTWYNHMDKDGNVDAAWMNRVHEVVDYVINQGMYCIVNVHHDTGADGESFKSWLKADETYYNTNKARYEKLWKQIAEEFKDYSQLLLFESYNEMLDTQNTWNYPKNSTAYSAINKYAESFVTTVRATGGNNAQRNLIVNTYCAGNGYGTWTNTDPLTKLNIPTGESNHIAFEVHAYPSITDGTTDKTITTIKTETDGLISTLKNNLASKGAPVIIGEWGTSNVDSQDNNDYDKRRDLMFQFAEYFVQKCKENDIATFYWMGITDGASRLFPAFSQADLAKTILQAYHGKDFNPSLPERSDYNNTCISATVNYNQQWGEFNLYTGSFSRKDYRTIELELSEAPESGLLHFKVYGSTEPTTDINAATSTLTITNQMGTITRITLQCKKTSGTVTVKNIWLVKGDGTKVPSDPSVFWGCTMSNVSLSTGIKNIINDITTADDRIYNLQGQQLAKPQKGIYIQSGKKYYNK